MLIAPILVSRPKMMVLFNCVRKNQKSIVFIPFPELKALSLDPILAYNDAILDKNDVIAPQGEIGEV